MIKLATALEKKLENQLGDDGLEWMKSGRWDFP
jgi:hypothetical protein